MPGGAGPPAIFASQRQRCRPGAICPEATRRGLAPSVRQTATEVGVRRLTRATLIATGPLPGATIRFGLIRRTYGRGARVSMRSLAGTITDRPDSRMVTRTW